MIGQVLAELTNCLSQVSSENLAQAAASIGASSRVFVAGAGRSGLCARALGMRLMHLGKIVFVVGETTTPAIAEEDLLILASGSGRTTSLLAIAEQAQRQSARILLFTADVTSPLAVLADYHVMIPAPTLTDARNRPDSLSVQPMGTLFEQSFLILADSLVLELMRQKGVRAGEMLERHANLE